MSFFHINLGKVYKALRLFKYIYGGYRSQIFIITILGFAVGLTGGIGIGILIPLFSFITGKTTESTDAISRAIEGVFSFLHLGFNLPTILTLMVVLFVAKALLLLTANYINAKVSEQYLEDQRNLLFSKTLKAGWPYLINQKIGYLDRVISEDSSYAAGVLRQIGDIMLRLTNLAVYVFIALQISITISLITLGSGVLIFFSLKPIFYKMRKLSEFLSITSKQTAHYINESLIGIKTIKVSVVEAGVIKKGASYFTKIRKAQIKSAFWGHLQSSIFEPMGLIFIVIVFAFSYKTPGFSIASFVVIIYLIQKIFSFIQAIQGKFNGINTSLPYLYIMTAYQQNAEQHQEKLLRNKNFKFNRALEIQDVSFTYPEQDQGALSNVSFVVKKGETIGIVGPSGSGKTTLVDLLLRLGEPQQGKITVDDEDLTSIDVLEWRRHIGYVSQDVFLLNDTIEANIRFYNPSISHDEIISATKKANIYDFIKKLPNDFQTIVGERGVKISGGQRQRVALARVLAQKPKILILDEATSALDTKSELLIKQAIDRLRGKITVLIIAHRLSTVMNADKLIVLEDGRIIESGSPKKLMENRNSYLFRSLRITK